MFIFVINKKMSEGQIYVKSSFTGRSVYTKLKDALNFNSKDGSQEDNKQEHSIKRNQKNNFKIKKYIYNKDKPNNKIILNKQKKKELILPDIHTINIYLNTVSSSEYSKAFVQNREQNCKSKMKKIYINKPTTEHLLINSFKNAIKSNKSIMNNAYRCVTEIDNIIKIKSLDSKESRFEDLANSFQKEEIKNILENEENSLKNKENNIKVIEECETQKITDDSNQNKGKTPSKKESSSKKVGILKNNGVKVNNLSPRGKKVKRLHNKHIRSTNFKSKLKNILFSAINYLHINNISVEEFHEENVFPPYPYSRQSRLLYLL